MRKLVCINGKTIIVSKWSKESGVCLRQKVVEEKISEIKAIPN